HDGDQDAPPVRRSAGGGPVVEIGERVLFLLRGRGRGHRRGLWFGAQRVRLGGCGGSGRLGGGLLCRWFSGHPPEAAFTFGAQRLVLFLGGQAAGGRFLPRGGSGVPGPGAGRGGRAARGRGCFSGLFLAGGRLGGGVTAGALG